MADRADPEHPLDRVATVHDVAAQLHEAQLAFAVNQHVDRRGLREHGVLLIGDVVAAHHDHRTRAGRLDPPRGRHGLRAVPEIHGEGDDEDLVRAVGEYCLQQRSLTRRSRRRDVLVHLDLGRQIRRRQKRRMQIPERRAVPMLVEQRHLDQMDLDHARCNGSGFHMWLRRASAGHILLLGSSAQQYDLGLPQQPAEALLHHQVERAQPRKPVLGTACPSAG